MAIKRINLRAVVWVGLGLSLAACGGGTDVVPEPGGGSSSSSSSSGAGGASSSSSSTSSSSGGSTLVNGAALFAAQCASCHAVTDQNLVKQHDLAGLVRVIAESMPLLNPASCVASCATDTAAYIVANNPHFGKGSSSSSSGGLYEVVAPQKVIDPAPVAVHRLNRSEYNNTVRDLFGTDLRPADNFPEDDFGYGFNNIAKVLSVSLTHMEQYFQAADLLVEEALDKALGGQYVQWEAESLTGTQVVAGTDRTVLNRGDSVLTVPLTAAASGEHSLFVRAGQQAGGPDPARMVLRLDGLEVGAASVAAPATAMMTYAFPVQLTAGDHTLSIAFTNDYWVQGEADRNLVLDWVGLQHEGAGDTTVIACDAAAGLTCARQTITDFGLRAWRRPLKPAEVNALAAVYEEGVRAGGDFRSGIGTVLRALMLSPHFLYRPELDVNLSAGEPLPLNPYELASRLSYFLWSSTPDAILLARAADGTLVNETVLRAQVRRMLDSPKAQMLVENFAVQWLKFDRVLEANPDLTRYPGFSAELVASMRQESRLFLSQWLADNAPVSELLSADYSYLDGRLAAHYGISGITGNGFVRHDWAGGKRQGILGHGSILTATSHPANTSPVRRGVWVLENLLCQAPPPPPPGVENIADDNLDGLTTRQRFELHRDTSTVCYSCHFMMDPIGFGLENYNAVGQWRDRENGAPVDASGSLPGGLAFAGPLELSQVLAGSPRLPLCVTQHLMTYALGRGVEALEVGAGSDDEPPDYPAVHRVYQRTAGGGHRIRDIIEEIVASPAFRQRRGADSEELEL